MNSKILKIIVAVLSVIGLVLFFRVAGIDAEDKPALSVAVSPLVTYSLILMGIAVVAAVVASLLGIMKNPAALKKTLLGVAALAVALLISYILASDTVVLDANSSVIAEAGSDVSKYTSTGIWISLILLVIGGGFFVYDLLKGLIKS
ncbi:hypothetical protein SAMN04489761_4587 [Tenacibaculum sp. MAR_2009_124]|uniref:hypothetical protein n=1 Tax=Tenacibaculum sp. MAR_2009_124 TaxID=1250059 RepID=UPI0008974629|nr:hypothetical protein [Tenacibaculum sp. MAR_2009_124]SED19721.1 hypothetical protein SAMN04489761_4587 [Tenacibaculum sp. MAR_2009_124]